MYAYTYEQLSLCNVRVKFCDQFHPHIKDYKILPSLVLLISSFSVFDSKGGEFVGPKASPPHNKYQNPQIQIFQDCKWYQAYKWHWMVQVVVVMGDCKEK
jgi:hypothetical protein